MKIQVCGNTNKTNKTKVEGKTIINANHFIVTLLVTTKPMFYSKKKLCTM